MEYIFVEECKVLRPIADCIHTIIAIPNLREMHKKKSLALLNEKPTTPTLKLRSAEQFLKSRLEIYFGLVSGQIFVGVK